MTKLLAGFINNIENLIIEFTELLYNIFLSDLTPFYLNLLSFYLVLIEISNKYVVFLYKFKWDL